MAKKKAAGKKKGSHNGHGLLDILQQVQAVRDELKAGKPVAAWEATLPIQQSLCDVAHAVGFEAAPHDAATRAEVETTLRECEALCENPPKGAGPVGKLGDGKLLAALFKLLLTVLPLLFEEEPA